MKPFIRTGLAVSSMMLGGAVAVSCGSSESGSEVAYTSLGNDFVPHASFNILHAVVSGSPISICVEYRDASRLTSAQTALRTSVTNVAAAAAADWLASDPRTAGIPVTSTAANTGGCPAPDLTRGRLSIFLYANSNTYVAESRAPLLSQGVFVDRIYLNGAGILARDTGTPQGAWAVRHEIGHAFGLGHEPSAHAVMAPSRVSSNFSSVLTSDDRAGYQAHVSHVLSLRNLTQVVRTTGPRTVTTTASRASDFAQDVFATEIEEAIKLGIMSGFSDGTFRPSEGLSREQAMVVALALLRSLPSGGVAVPTSVSSAPFSDVRANRWSAPHITVARQLGLSSGYPDGTFRPSALMTRAEFVILLTKITEISTAGNASKLTSLVTPPTAFTDISGHWAASAITGLSGLCASAPPSVPKGTQFEPNAAAKRSFAAASSVRLRSCLLRMP